jgi:integrase
VPRIALLSGMRLEEICGLEIDQLTKIDGVLCFDIRKGKTETSVRPVPVHSQLLPLLELAPASGFIFPDLKTGGPDKKRSWNLGKRLGRTFRTISGGSTFHGFRKTVAQTFERAGVPETSAALILGHRRNDITYGIYSPHGLRMSQRKKIVEGLSLPMLP